MKNVLTAILLILSMQTAWAIDLQDAKSQGLVGEANTGYLAAVQQPVSAEVKALIADVNAKRKAEFERTAEKTNISTRQVSNRFYELAVEKTKSGHYYQDTSGNWKKK
ncbi:MAG: YdbL family protein [Gammaproteobacteria bacterium]|nr:YdbL family protein [Gammaproteobacteria bacterium]MDH3430026.1 YdbL family protein [Gammaproteobacteria bacterium]MDH3433183.1 YdbL family protein [Gammaproteobacteria bacterium]